MLFDRLPAIAAASLLALFATGCHTGLVDFTHELRDQHRLSNDELKNLQYYVSDTITLRKELESGGKQITGNHKLILVEGKTIEEVTIPAKTPGIALAVTDHSITVSFEQGTSLVFAASGGDSGASAPRSSFASPPDPFPGNNPDRPQPLPIAADQVYSGYYSLVMGPTSTVTFQGKVFEAINDSIKAHLMIDSESLEQKVQNNKTLPGLRLPTK
jgi:hypothetical protein